jgi:peptide/nickel transport system permease protein
MEPGLRTYILKRVGFAVLMLVGVSIILFTIMRLAPGGPEAVLIGGEFSQEAAAQIRQRLGLDRPLALQYLGWAGGALRGDLGRSFKTGDPVAALILDRLGPTIQLTFGALALALVVAVPLGVLAAVRPRDDLGHARLGRRALRRVVPELLARDHADSCSSPRSSTCCRPRGSASTGARPELTARVRHAILPTLTLGLIQMASFMRFTRSSLLEVLRQDYVRTARAKGLGGGRVVWHHALRNALIPVVTVVGLSLPTLVGGAVLTETVFAWPGIGRLAVGAVFERDYPVIMGVNLMVAAVVISANLLTDLAYCVIDPRISYR